jgi:hypothetical protein
VKSETPSADISRLRRASTAIVSRSAVLMRCGWDEGEMKMKPGEEDELAPVKKLSKREAAAGDGVPAGDGKSNHSQLIAFSKTSSVVRQDDLVEERILYQKAMRRVEAWQEKVSEIRAAIEAGGTVEPGIYRADVVDENCETPLGFTFPVRKLVVR